MVATALRPFFERYATSMRHSLDSDLQDRESAALPWFCSAERAIVCSINTFQDDPVGAAFGTTTAGDRELDSTAVWKGGALCSGEAAASTGCRASFTPMDRR